MYIFGNNIHLAALTNETMSDINCEISIQINNEFVTDFTFLRNDVAPNYAVI